MSVFDEWLKRAELVRDSVQVFTRPSATFASAELRGAAAALEDFLSAFERLQAPGRRLMRAKSFVTEQLNEAALEFREPATRGGGAVALSECLTRDALPFIRAVIREGERLAVRARALGLAETQQIGTAHRDQDMPPPGVRRPGTLSMSSFGNWKLGNQFGGGGHASVYLAENVVTSKTACAKVIFFSSDDAEEQRKRFEREVRVPAEVGHPGLVEIYDAGESSSLGAFVIVMEYVLGEHIDRWARNRSSSEIVPVFLEVLPPLAECHDRGLIHRDIKPSNLLVAPDGSVRVLDFGLAHAVGAQRLTKTGDFLGTERYVSPEQARDASTVTPQSDVWSLGVVLCELMTKTTLFPQATSIEVLSAVLDARYEAPEAKMPAEIAAVVRRCLQKEPEARYENVDSLRYALEKIALPEPLPPSPAYGAATMPSPKFVDMETCLRCGASIPATSSRCIQCGSFLNYD